jgi:hypothetical protein
MKGGGGSAEHLVALENQHLQASASAKAAGSQAAKSRTNYYRVEISAHGRSLSQLSYMSEVPHALIFVTYRIAGRSLKKEGIWGISKDGL